MDENGGLEAAGKLGPTQGGGGVTRRYISWLTQSELSFIEQSFKAGAKVRAVANALNISVRSVNRRYQQLKNGQSLACKANFKLVMDRKKPAMEEKKPVPEAKPNLAQSDFIRWDDRTRARLTAGR